MSLIRLSTLSISFEPCKIEKNCLIGPLIVIGGGVGVVAQVNLVSLQSKFDLDLDLGLFGSGSKGTGLTMDY